ncbi:hypothetical protein SAPIO_CDS4557 [Scedosporium apiospermum]|uniref:Uncharacterized protein n=1 Tax=Pseudallescheria apiosperma TaxID=563466 RepID=A0A084G7S6_PSEDA|nr:uncharacterized protein SAPIO_CDS4557 [Scedosporium apiospermum]KEZ43388.1 hypothetical protein SAPIO_CDS4557 [Scedosporium apiospermum]
MSTINMVKYYFYKDMLPSNQRQLEQLVALAYQTARDRKLHPKAVLIRSGFHDTTTARGRRIKDPKGWHVTICYKDSNQVLGGTHVACHAYTPGKNIFELVESTHAGEKSDDVLRARNQKPVWPDTEELAEAPEIGYGHLPEDWESSA